MVTKTECISIFNAIIRGTPISLEKQLFPLISDYLTEIKYENSDKIIYLLTQNPQLIENAYPTIEEYFCIKYNIFKLIKLNNFVTNQTILYYE